MTLLCIGLGFSGLHLFMNLWSFVSWLSNSANLFPETWMRTPTKSLQTPSLKQNPGFLPVSSFVLNHLRQVSYLVKRAAARGSQFAILGGRAPSCLPLKSKGGAAVAELRGGENMVRRFLITVRIRRADGPPRVRIFVVHIARAAGEWAAPSVRAAVALVLMLVRSQRRAQRRILDQVGKASKIPGRSRPLGDFV